MSVPLTLYLSRSLNGSQLMMILYLCPKLESVRLKTQVQELEKIHVGELIYPLLSFYKTGLDLIFWDKSSQKIIVIDYDKKKFWSRNLQKFLLIVEDIVKSKETLIKHGTGTKSQNSVWTTINYRVWRNVTFFLWTLQRLHQSYYVRSVVLLVFADKIPDKNSAWSLGFVTDVVYTGTESEKSTFPLRVL